MDARTKWIPLLALLMGTSVAGASTENDIKDAAKAFALALSKGDATEAKRHATSDETTTLMIDTLSPLIIANNNLRTAAAARFGQAAAIMIAGDSPGSLMDDWAKRTDAAIVKIDGETATVATKEAASNKPAPSGPATRPQESPPLKLKLENNSWKVDFSGIPDAAALKQNSTLIAAMARAMNETAEEVRTGKFSTAKDAKLALDQKQAVIASHTGARGRGR
ncbi:MAG TPA: hypothetical protein VH370_08075 [Humisphaera sp.]|jgi:hypothetical protein|nr:hypothetical protein [Humisphaera sp.]